MRALMLFPAASLLLAAQTPVDYPALRKEVQAAVGAVGAAMKAEVAAGKPRNQVKPDFAKALEAIRAKGQGAQGELKEACLVAELAVVARFGPDPALVARVIAEVPAGSGAWAAAQDILPYLPQILEKPGEAYLQQMREKGIPDVRASLQAAQVGDLLEEGKVEEAKALVARLEKEFPGNPAVKEAGSDLAAELKTAVGVAAPDFKLASLDNPQETLTKASFKGRYLLVDFWGTWCGWCVKELPNTHKVYAAFKAKGLEILSLASDKSPETVQNFRKKPETPMPWKHAFIGRGKDVDPVLEAYGVKGFPTLFLIGPDGKILAKGGDLRGEALEKTLGKFLK